MIALKVNNYGSISEVMKAYISRKKDVSHPDRARINGGGDTLELSVQAREIQDIKSALVDIEAVREEKVESIKQQISAGTYLPDASKIADGIIQERLLDKHI